MSGAVHTPSVLERLRFYAEHGMFKAVDAGMHCSYAEAADTITELLEALQELVELDGDGEAGCRVDPISYGQALNNARDAIAKARGETQ